MCQRQLAAHALRVGFAWRALRIDTNELPLGAALNNGTVGNFLVCWSTRLYPRTTIYRGASGRFYKQVYIIQALPGF